MTASDISCCKICLKIDAICCFTTFSSNNWIFGLIFNSTTLPEKIHICMWCKAALKITYNLFKTAEESKKVLENNNENQMHLTAEKLGLKCCFSLSINHNTHEDIPPMNYEEQLHKASGSQMLFEETEKVKAEIEEIHIDNIEETNNHEIKTEKVMKSKKLINYKELKFDLKYLSYEEQISEIESKKNMQKYKQMKYQCEKCGIGFLTSDVFEKHIRRHSETTDFACTVCHLHFKSKDVLSQHTLAHSRKFVCTVCGSRYTRWQHCVLHRFNCDGIRHTVVCVVCKKVFSNAISLDIHMRSVHQKEKKYLCTQCHKRFGTKQRLTVHERTHSGSRLFSCLHCPHSFTTKSNLNAHQNVHSNEKSHYCVECNLHYKTFKGLKRHFRESARHAEKGDLRYKCPDCPKQFSTETMLSSHVNSRHLMTYQCTICDKKYSSNTNLRKHRRCVHATQQG